MGSCLVNKEIKTRKRKINQPFFNENLQKLKKALEKERKKFLKNPNAQNESSFKKNRKNYNKELEKSKQSYYHEQIKKVGTNSKDVWKVINNILNRDKTDNPDETIIVNGNKKSNHKEISNIFSNFYQTAATNKLKNLKTKSHYKDFLPQNHKRDNTFKLKAIDNHQTWKLINTLSSKTSS